MKPKQYLTSFLALYVASLGFNVNASLISEEEAETLAVKTLKNQVEQIIEEAPFKPDKQLVEDQNALIQLEGIDETLKRGGVDKDLSAQFLTVLSIDGGGVRGLMPAKWLEYIESLTNMRIDQLFDYVGGTSIGGILALGVSASTDHTTRLVETSELVKIFKDHGKEIFPKRGIATIIRGLVHCRYDATPLEKLLNYHFKDATLGNTCTNVVVTSVKVSDHSRFLFKSRNEVQKDYKLSLVARATSAAPTFFKACYIPEMGEYVVDGGVVANNPTIITCNEAYNYKPVLEDKRFVVSLGTGTIPKPLFPIPHLFKHPIPHHGGVLFSAVPVIEAAIKGYSEGVQKLFERSSLAHNSLRVNPALSRFIGIDDASDASINDLEELAEGQFAIIDQFFTSDSIQRILDAKKPDF